MSVSNIKSTVMRLSTLIPSLSPELVSSLEVSGIRTDADLLFKPIFELYRQLPVETGISLADLENAVALTAQLAAASGTSGDELLTQCIQAEEKAATLFSGVKGLDDLLGGFGGRRVIEISGDRQSGKTSPSTALDRLQVSLAFDIEAAYSILDEVRNSFATTGDTTTVSCIVIDAITPLLGPLLSSVSAHGHSVMTEFGYHLRSFSQTHSCPMLVSNI
ncbi:hypothetical protein H0H93_016539 [Arthromyces matolae]|nr:hypothetical protein H0H93_016539 [Arthromyces matolae]